MLKFEIVEVKGFRFQVGVGDAYGPVFTIEVEPGRFEGCRLTKNVGDELGFMSGCFATAEMVEAIEEARKLIPTK